jgi:hypothetical protein
MQKRPYDFEDIKRRRDAGEKWASIAADYGRSKQAVEVATRRAAAPGEDRMCIGWEGRGFRGVPARAWCRATSASAAAEVSHRQ